MKALPKESVPLTCLRAIPAAFQIGLGGKYIDGLRSPPIADMGEYRVVENPLVSLSGKTAQIISHIVVLCRHVDGDWKNMVIVAPFPKVDC